MNENKRKNLTIKEASKAYGLSVSWLYKKSMQRSIPILKIGSKKVLIPVEEFEQWLSSHRVDNEGKR